MSLRSLRRLAAPALVTVALVLTATPAVQAAVPAGAPARAMVAAAEPDPRLPDDADTTTPGLQIRVPYPAEPEFLLTAGDERWNVRNRPQGSVAAGYGHEDDADHEALTSTARYRPRGSTTFTLGSISADRQPLDVAVLGPETFRTQTWTVTRYSDSSVEIEGPLERGLTSRYVYGPSDGNPGGYVGGAVLVDNNGAPVVFLVERDGSILQIDHDNEPVQFRIVGNVGQEALGAIPRTYTKYTKSPRFGDVTDREPASGSTLMMVLTTDGVVRPFRIGVTGGFTPLPTYSGVGNIPTEPGDTLMDFDFSCVTADRSVATEDPVTGVTAAAIGCGAGTPRSGSPDTVSMGRISWAFATRGEQNSPAWIGTSADFVEVPASGIWVLRHETRGDAGCDFGAQAPAPGSFDLRTVLGTTHLACATNNNGAVEVQDYMQPSTSTAIAAADRPEARQREDTFATFVPRRTTFDRLFQPGPDEDVPGGDVPLKQETYEVVGSPTLQLQFPCADLLGRRLPAGSTLDDCDPSIAPVQLPIDPINWKSYSIAGYGDVSAAGGTQRRLFVHTAPAIRSPFDKAVRDTIERPLYGPNYDEANFSWTVEPAAYRADDLQRVREEESIDPQTLQVYQVPDSGQRPPLMLAQVPRPSTTPVVLTIDNPETFSTQTSPSVPVAVLQAPPTVEGLGQQVDFTPEFAVGTDTGTATTQGKSTRLGAHVETQATFSAGAGIAGNEVTVGAGFNIGFEFMNEVEQAIERVVEVSTTEAYGGSFGYHTVVTRAIKEDTWQGTITADPTGLATGESFTYRIPSGEVTQSVPLPKLAKEKPALYGPNGLLRPSLDLMVDAVTIGDPSSYLPGSGQQEPSSVRLSAGGPCKGGYGTPDNPTSFDGDLPAVISPDNPFFNDPPDTPTGPNIVASAEHTVSIGNDLAEGASIGITEGTSRSLLSSKSFDFSASGILKAEASTSIGVATKLEVEVSAGIDSGWSESAGVTESLANGSELAVTMGNIPFGTDDVGSWVDQEQYRWRMFMCKAPLGPVGMGAEVWLQGYVVDGYGGSKGITELSPAAAVAPVASPVALADPTGIPTDEPEQCTPSERADFNRFRWAHPAGTVQDYELQLEDITAGGAKRPVVAEWSTPRSFNDTVRRFPGDDRPGVQARPSCADMSAADFDDGHLYRWRIVADGFVGNQERSDWEFLRPQVWPATQQLALRTPLVNGDDSVTLDVVDPPNVRSLRHDVTIRRVATGDVVDQGNDVGRSFRTNELPDGSYEATFVGYNDHRSGGTRVETPPATVRFTVGAAVRAQFDFLGCDVDCTTSDTVTFLDRSTSSREIVSWEWDFGDGDTSTAKNPSHRFDEPSGPLGYPVTLTIEDGLGRSASVTERIRVLESDTTVDTDEDGVPDIDDNCASVANPDQADADSDGVGDLCDLTPTGDQDSDGVEDAVDNCPAVANPGQADNDGDGTGNACDSTPGTSRFTVSVGDPAPVNERKALIAIPFTVRLDKPADRPLLTSYRTADRSATAGKDYRARSGVLSWQPGQQVKTVRVFVLADRRKERTERFVFRLREASAGVSFAQRRAFGVIRDDD